MPAKTKDSVASVTQKLYDLLEPLESGDRQRAVAATLTLLGERAINTSNDAERPGDTGSSGSGNGPTDMRAYFDEKAPQSKMEELAVAARYRELQEDAHEHTKEDFQSAIRAARRNFDAGNYSRDLGNAKMKGLFNKGRDNTLAYYGQEYVDALPDRAAAKALRAPRQNGRKGAAKKKAAARKSPSAKA